MPGGPQLAKEMSEKFLSKKFAKLDLMRVAELAASQGGRSAFNQWLQDFFTPFEPTEAHLEDLAMHPTVKPTALVSVPSRT